ncbi:MAG: hypothetical protein ACRDKJ_06305 [Actinomycetota bacterium]
MGEGRRNVARGADTRRRWLLSATPLEFDLALLARGKRHAHFRLAASSEHRMIGIDSAVDHGHANTGTGAELFGPAPITL